MSCCCPSPGSAAPGAERRAPGRRGFLRLAGLAGGAALFQALPSPARASGAAEALVLSCMDYRLADNVHSFMDSLGMTDRYDHIVLAGASLGVLHEDFEAWHQTFWGHLEVAIDLHGIERVICIDHRDCGAYTLAFGPGVAADPAAETILHRDLVALLQATIATRRPALAFDGYLMALDGTVERLVGAG